MKYLWRIFVIVMLGVKLWKHWQVWRYFRQPVPPSQRAPELVSIMQPILSGDPTLEQSLRGNLQMQTRYPVEFVWLIDDNDVGAQELCQRLAAEYPARQIKQVQAPPPPQGNPKMVKLIAGLEHVAGDVVCVLDDDTQLPDGGLEQCLPYLDQPNVGLAFGLPYYRSFDNLWSSLIALFVNNNSLLTYVPYLQISEPLTINGMFYVIRRDLLAQLGDFQGLEDVLADDFAVAQYVREGGYKLKQTPIRHGIRTFVNDATHYRQLLQRWFIFPRESLLRHLSWREQGIIYTFHMLPALFPLAVVLWVFTRPSAASLAYAAAYFGHTIVSFAHINEAYLDEATPKRLIVLVPLVESIFPLQLLVALLSPQRMTWRGHVIEVEHGGGFHFVRRRDE
ncbi:MAG: glycosyltransferase [Chloroflexi bacterium AL-N5]|nr:glycosyltransferase [Chloroflexi bacterium AL-N5]